MCYIQRIEPITEEIVLPTKRNKSYKDLLRVKEATPIFCSVAASRFSTMSVDMVLFVFLATEFSLLIAAIGLALINIGVAFSNPVQGKLSDRFGQRKVLSTIGVLYLMAILTFVLVASGMPQDITLAFLLLIGLVRPSGQTFGRSAWQVLYKNDDDRFQAAALDGIQASVVNTSAVFLGTTIAYLWNPLILLGILACSAAIANWSLAFNPVAKKLHRAQEKIDHDSGWLFSDKRMIYMLFIQVVYFFTDGAMVIVVFASAEQVGQAGLAGVGLGLFLVGLATGAWVFGKNAERYTDRTASILRVLKRFFAALVFLVLASLIWFPLILLLLPIAGYMRAGFTPSIQIMAQEVFSLKQINQAVGLLFAGLTIGAAFGRVATGIVTDLWNPTAAWLLLLVAVGLAYLGTRALRKLILSVPDSEASSLRRQ